MKLALTIKSLSTCHKRQVGCVIYTPNNSYWGINHGNNETCNCNMNSKNPNVLHAEIHALSYVPLDETILNVAITYPPCENCQQALLKRGVKNLTLPINDLSKFNKEYITTLNERFNITWINYMNLDHS